MPGLCLILAPVVVLCPTLCRTGCHEQVDQPRHQITNKPPLQNQSDYVTNDAWCVCAAEQRTQDVWEKAERGQRGGFGMVNNRSRGETPSQNYRRENHLESNRAFHTH